MGRACLPSPQSCVTGARAPDLMHEREHVIALLISLRHIVTPPFVKHVLLELGPLEIDMCKQLHARKLQESEADWTEP